MGMIDWFRSVWPWRQILERREWHRKDREEIVVATCEYTTDMVAGVEGEMKSTGIKHTHVLTLLIDGNGVRYSRTHSTCSESAGSHRSLLRDKLAWKFHAEVPSYGRRVDGPPRGKLIAFPGGAA